MSHSTVFLTVRIPLCAEGLNVEHYVDDRNNDSTTLVFNKKCVVGENEYVFEGSQQYGKKTVEDMIKQHTDWGNIEILLHIAMCANADIGEVCKFVKENFYTQNIEIML